MSTGSSYFDSNLPTCGTVVRYRDVTIVNVQTKRFDQKVVYDDNNANLLYHEFSMSFTGHIHCDDPMDFGVNLGGILNSNRPDNDGEEDDVAGPDAEPQNRLAAIQGWLMHPRGDFYMYQEGQEILICLGDSFGERGVQLERQTGSELPGDFHDRISDHDVENGPKPQSVNVRNITGTKAYEIDFSIDFRKVICDPEILGRDLGDFEYQHGEGALTDRMVLSNTWETTESRGSDFMLTRSLVGTLKIRRHENVAHHFRFLCIPPMFRGFQREYMKFGQSKDGLRLDYEVRDRQRYAAPPAPAIDWRGSQTENIEGIGENAISSVNVWLQGAPSTPKRELLFAAIATIEHRLGDLRVNPEDGSRHLHPVSLVMVDTLHLNEISLTATFRRFVSDDGGALDEQLANILISSVGSLPAVNGRAPTGDPDTETRSGGSDQYNRDAWPNPVPYDAFVNEESGSGQSLPGIFATFLQNPCIGIHGVPTSQIVPYNTDVPDPVRDDTDGRDGVRTPAAGPFFVHNYELTGDEPDTAISTEVSNSHFQFMYTFLRMESKYKTDTGAADLGRGDGGSCIVNARGNRNYRTVWIKAIRAGRRPEMPQPLDRIVVNPATGTLEEQIEVLKEYEIGLSSRTLMPNGQGYEYETEYFMKYLLNYTPTNLRGGRLPWVSEAVGQEDYDRTANEIDTII